MNGTEFTFLLSFGGAEWRLTFEGIGIVLAFFVLSGVSIAFWSCIALLRLATETLTHVMSRRRKIWPHSVQWHEVAAIVPAHNEETTIGATLTALLRILPPQQIYVGSDASTDRTVEIVRSMGCTVMDIRPNRGKAGVLKHLMDHFGLLERYKAVLIVDADTQIDRRYLLCALPLFDDRSVVAVAGHAETHWVHHVRPHWSMLFVAYRMRLYAVLQALLRYPQTWTYTNVSIIVPGFASMYRSEALRKIDIVAPGLIIEDFNMTFELRRKRLGKVAYAPQAFATCHDPYSLRDYCKQVFRWHLGFWQTVRRHGVWPSFFWLSLGPYIIENFISSLFFLTTPFWIVLLIANGFQSMEIPLPAAVQTTLHVGFLDILFGVFVADYLLTVVVSVLKRRPMLLIYGVLFSFVRYIDAVAGLYAIPAAFFKKTEGRWTSPAREMI